MPPELFYYLVWYGLSRFMVVGVTHYMLKAAARETKGKDVFRGINPALLLLCFVPIGAEALLLVFLTGVAGHVATTVALDAIERHYRRPYGGES